jgi:class 3 adenylate cyclase/predicted ATPase
MSLDVRKWLEASGFGRYASLFETNEIDGEALLGLTDEHLRELGLPVGHRVKLLKAIMQIGAPPVAAPVPSPVPVPAQAPATVAAAERRQLTVMFVDLVGSTALSSRLDPEDLRTVIRSYQKAVAEEVARFGGHVAQYLGDGVLAYFGFPVAHEDEAERAVRAALAIVGAVAGGSAPGGAPLAARIGIATGLVVVGDLVGEGASKEHAVVGETPNLAARLQGLAEPGQVVIGARTRELAGHLFELRDLGPQQLRGIAAPVAAHVVEGERAVESRFEALLTGQPAEMVGRDGELALLLERWRMALAGENQLVVVSGDAGIGKSRLLRALQDSIAGEPHMRINYQCSPYRAGSALFPVIQQITRAAGIGPADSVESRLDRLEALFDNAGPRNAEALALIAALLGIDGAQRYGPIQLTPQQQRQRTFEALIRPPVLLSRTQPVLLVLEDAHWIDPSTLELLDLCAEQFADCRIMTVVSARPEFTHDFGGRRDVSRIVLNRLGRAQIALVAHRVARGKVLPAALLGEIAEKTDGVPLFVEELTKTLLESGLLRETEDAFLVDASASRIVVPASLHDSLMARLDRLQPVKEVAQTAACIGREFDLALLASVVRTEQSTLEDALTQLAEAEIVFRRRTPGPARYAFKHALLRDAAYESLLKAKRQQIHQRLVGALEAAQAPPELLAHHALQAGLNERAIDYLQKAAAQAVARPAYKEAITHLRQAIALTEQMGERPPWPERLLLLLLALGQASIPLRGYGHEQTVSPFLRAQQLAATMKDPPHGVSIAYAVWSAHYTRGEQDKALRTAQDMLSRAEADGNVGHIVNALRALAISQMISGAPLLARESFARVSSLADAVRQRSQEKRVAVAQRFAADPEIATQFYVALTLWALGEVERARGLVVGALAEARSMQHAHTLGHALAHATIFAIICRDSQQALALSAETMDYTAKHELAMFRGYGAILHAFALALTGDNRGSVPAMEGGFAYMAQTQTGAMVPMHHALHARTLAALGRHEEAAHHAALAQKELDTGSDRYFWPETQRLLGDYLSLCPHATPEQIAAAYERALALAHGQQAKSWALYAALSLAHHWSERGERRRAHELLAPVHAALDDGNELQAYRDAALFLQEPQ